MTARTEDEALRVELGDRNLRKARESEVGHLRVIVAASKRKNRTAKFVLMSAADIARLGLSGARIHGLSVVPCSQAKPGKWALADSNPDETA